MGRHRLPLLVPVVLTLFFLPTLLAGCKEQHAGLHFTHLAHQERTPNCAICHPMQNEEIGRAGHAQCQACHTIEQAKPSEQCLQCHDSEHPVVTPLPRPNYAQSPPEHEKHAQAQVPCEACHGPVTKAIRFPDMDECLACHYPGRSPEQLAENCGTCHWSLNREHKPASHDAAWTLMHGPSSGAQGIQGSLNALEDTVCRRCHAQRDCDQCHRVTPPRDHSRAFKVRGHGMLSAANPERCATCHRQDFCQHCHATVQPSYHSAGFKTSRPYSHCGMCHLPLEEGNRCTACHNTVRHDQARAQALPPPPIVNRNQGCFELGCHPLGRSPVKHLYNTIPDTQCILCH